MIVTEREHLKAGIESGFSMCCIVWFFVRRYTNYDLADKLVFKHKKIEHVLCPACSLFLKVFKIKVFYSFCKKCDWLQYKKFKCNHCLEIPENPKVRPIYRVINKQMIIVGYSDNLDKNIEDLRSGTIVE